MAIRIDLDIGRGTGVETTIERLIGALDRLQDRLDGIKSSTKGMGRGLGQAAQGVTNVGAAARQSLGPMQRLVRAQQQLAAAKSSGDPARIFDAQHALTRAENALARAKGVKSPGKPPPTPQEMLQQALMRTRFSASGAGFPLGVDIQRIMRSGGNVSALFGTGGKGGAAAGGGTAATAIMRVVAAVSRLVVPVGLAVMGVTALWKAANSAAKSLNELAQARAATGGTSGEVSAIERIGRSLGINGTTGSVKQFAEEIRSGIGAGAAASIGISPHRGAFGELNSARDFIKAIEHIANLKSDEEARRFAKKIESLEQYLPIRDMSPRMRQAVLNDARREAARGDNKLGIQRAADHTATVGRFFSAWENLKRSTMPILAMGLEKLTLLVTLFTARVELLTSIIDRFAAFIERIRQIVLDWLGMGEQVRTSQADHARSMDNHSRAMKEFGETLGGGSRARSALPSGIKGWQLSDDQIRREGLRLGVY